MRFALIEALAVSAVLLKTLRLKSIDPQRELDVFYPAAMSFRCVLGWSVRGLGGLDWLLHGLFVVSSLFPCFSPKHHTQGRRAGGGRGAQVGLTSESSRQNRSQIQQKKTE